jgi:hypothetical protein
MNTYRIVKTLVLLQAIGAAIISFMHIVEVGQRYGLGWQAWVAPFLIDGFAILGTIGRGAAFAPAARRLGFRLMLGAGAVSLACNVLAGTNVGQRVFGVLVVVGFVAAEWYATRLAPAPAAAPVTDEAKARRSEAARRGAETRKRNAAAKQKAQRAAVRAERAAARAPKAPADSAAAARMLARAGSAPVSPAPYSA